MIDRHIGMIGREAETKAFRDAARELLETDNRAEPRPIVMLLWGIGGIGKSTLTHQYKHIAESEPPFERDLAVVRLDWEAAPSRIKGVPTPDPEAIMDYIADQIEQAGHRTAFQKYHETQKARRKAEQELAGYLSGQSDSRLAPLAGLAVKVVAELVRNTGKVAGVPGSDEAATILETHGEAAVRQALTILQQRLGDERWLLATEPHTVLARELGEGLRAAARRRRLVFIQDTYEIVDSADPTLREAIFSGGPRVLWVIAGRRDLARSDHERRYLGYRSISDRVRLRLLEVGEFSLDDIKSYFGRDVPERSLPSEGVERIQRTTQGIPMAVRMAAEVWRETGDLAALGAGGGERDELVGKMADRFLTHCTDGEERLQLYALALLRRPKSPLLAAMCGADGDADSVIRRLGARYDFIFVAEGWLHETVRYFLREQMKGRLRSDTLVRGLNEAAVAAAAHEREQQEAGRPTWEDRVDSGRWSDCALDEMHHRLWLDPTTAATRWPAYFLAGLAYDRGFSGALLELVIELDGGDSKRYRDVFHDLRSLTQMPWSVKADVAAMGHLKRLFQRLEAELRGDAELVAVLGWAEARLLLDQDDANAQRAGETLLALLPTLEDHWLILRERVGEALYDAGRRLLFPGGRATAVSTAQAAPLLEAAKKCKAWEEDRSFWTIYGVAMNQAGRYSEAIAAYREAIRLDPNNALRYSNLGTALGDQGDLAGAEAAYREAIRLDPTLAAAHYNLGNALGDQGDLLGAVAAFREAIRLDPTLAIAHSNLGFALGDQGDLAGAEAAYREAIRLDPTLAAAHSNLGNALGDQGDLAGAEAAYREAIRLDPTLAAAHVGLGNALGDQGDLAGAEAAYREAIRLDPTAAAAHSNLGTTLRTLERWDEAEAAHRRALELDESSYEDWAALADMARRRGDEAAWRTAIERARPLVDRTDLYNAACFESIAGNTDEALRLLCRAVQHAPGNAAWARLDPDLHWIRDDPRFEAALAGPCDD